MTNPIPDGFRTVTPHLVIAGAAAAIDFYKTAFGAEELFRSYTPDGAKIMHATIRIGDSNIMLVDDMPEMSGGKSMSPQALGGSPIMLSLYVADCDAATARAEAAGATITMPPADMFWGDRFAMLTDPFGHLWTIATQVATPTHEEMEAAMATAFAKKPA
ncbi:MAG: VOC family protein [bacterium]